MGMADACACDRLAEDKLLLNTQKLYFRTPIFATFASMKPTKFFACLFAAWCTLCLCCCDDKPSYNARLTAIDSIADTDAPRALAMLDSLKPRMAGATEADRNLYSLMRVKAEDKAFVTHKTDTLMLRLVDYYETDGDKALLPTAYYYAGRVYSDMNDGKRALQYFQKAVEMIDSSSVLYYKAYSQMGNFFLYQGLYRKGFDAFSKAYKHYKKKGDSIGQIDALCGMAYCLQRNGNERHVLKYFKHARTLARKIGNKPYEAEIIAQIANHYYNIGDYKKAKSYIKFALKDIEGVHRRSIYAIVADIYEKVGEEDLAINLTKKLYSLNDVYAKCAASKKLGFYYLKNGNVQKAIFFLDEYSNYFDSIQSITQTEAVARIDASYNYSLKEKENARLRGEIEKDRYSLNISVAVMISVVLFLVFFALSIKKKRYIERMKYENERRYIVSKYEQSKAFIDENNKRLLAMRQLLSESANANERLSSALKANEEQLRNLNKMTEIKIENRKLAETELANSDICAKILAILNDKTLCEFDKKLSAKDWLSLDTEVECYYPDFKNRISSLCRLSELEYHVCLLLKIGIKAKDISVLVSKSKSSVSAIRRRLYFKAFNKDVPPEAWDKFIRSL